MSVQNQTPNQEQSDGIINTYVILITGGDEDKKDYYRQITKRGSQSVYDYFQNLVPPENASINIEWLIPPSFKPE